MMVSAATRTAGMFRSAKARLESTVRRQYELMRSRTESPEVRGRREEIAASREEDVGLRTHWTPDAKRDWTPYRNSAEHFEKHRHEFPEIRNYNEYVEAAHRFLKEPSVTTQSFVRKNGDIMRYDPVTNTFGVLRADGVPRTMFRPGAGQSYWQSQLQVWKGKP